MRVHACISRLDPFIHPCTCPSICLLFMYTRKCVHAYLYMQGEGRVQGAWLPMHQAVQQWMQAGSILGTHMYAGTPIK